MATRRQMPLFPEQPESADDLNRHSPLGAAIPLFQQHLLKEGKSEHTVKAFTSDLQLLAEQSAYETPLGKYTTTRLNEFLHWLENGRGVPCSRKSYARRVTTLKVFFKWAHEIGALPADPAQAVLQRSGPAPLPIVLAPDEVRDALAHSRTMTRNSEYDTRPELLFRLLLQTGIKKGETVSLTPASLDRSNPDAPILWVRHKARNVYKERKLLLEPEWPALLDRYLAQYHPEETIFDCTARNLEYILADIGEGAGIPLRISFEMMRWTCAVRDYRDGLEANTIREKLGLSTISWTETHNKIRQLVEQQVVQESGA